MIVKGARTSLHHQHGLERRSHREERNTAAHHQRLAPLTAPPGDDAGVPGQDREQEETQLADQHPWIGHALGDGDRVAEKRTCRSAVISR